MSSSSPPPKDSFVAALREYGTADTRTLGLFRIVFGVLLLADLFRRLPDYVFFYTNEGMLPNHGSLWMPMSNHLFSIYHAASTRGEVLAMFAATAVVYLAYVVGYRTRVAQVLALICVTSLHSRNVLLENGGDVVVNLLALWTAFLPLGNRFSIDSILADRRGQPLPQTAVVSVAYAAAFLNLAAIYYFNTVHKDGFAWKNGTSVHYVLWADRLVQPFGVWVRSWIPLAVIRVLTIGTLVMEATITTLLLSPMWIRSCRRVAALMIITLHCGFQTLGHFGLFSFAMMMHAVLLIGPEDWEALAVRMKGRLPSRTLEVDASSALSLAIGRAARALDRLGKITVIESSEPIDGGVRVTSARGTPRLGGAALTSLFRALPYGVFPARILELPILRWVFDGAFRAILASSLLGSSIRPFPPAEPARPPLFGRWAPRAREALALVFVAALGSQVIAENRRIPLWMKVQQPALFAAIAQYPRFFQGWSMFAPVPPTDDGKIVVDAVTVDGRHLDPLRGGGDVDMDLPDVGHGMIMSQFWYELHDRLRRNDNARYRRYFQDWLAAWNVIEEPPARDKIVAYEVYWVYRRTQPPGSRERTEPHRERFLSLGPDTANPPVSVILPSNGEEVSRRASH